MAHRLEQRTVHARSFGGRLDFGFRGEGIEGFGCGLGRFGFRESEGKGRSRGKVVRSGVGWVGWDSKGVSDSEVRALLCGHDDMMMVMSG